MKCARLLKKQSRTLKDLKSSSPMKRQVLTYNAIEGFHCWPDAPDECKYLASRHRHIFVIRCKVGVTHNERQVEIITRQHEIESYLQTRYFNCKGDGANCCDFGNMSCESIAEDLLNRFYDIDEVEVTEDGYGGATLTR